MHVELPCTCPSRLMLHRSNQPDPKEQVKQGYTMTHEEYVNCLYELERQNNAVIAAAGFKRRAVSWKGHNAPTSTSGVKREPGIKKEQDQKPANDR